MQRSQLWGDGGRLYHTYHMIIMSTRFTQSYSSSRNANELDQPATKNLPFCVQKKSQIIDEWKVTADHGKSRHNGSL